MASRIKTGLIRKKIKQVVVILLGLVILAPLLFWLYVKVQTYPADSKALQAISNEPNLEIEEIRSAYILRPNNIIPGKETLIFYPGGLVDPQAYLYKMGRVAIDLGKTVYVIKAPFNAAIFDINAAGRIIEEQGLGRAWVGGHSLGGIAACRFAGANPNLVYGLFIFGSYCDRDITGLDGPTISVMGLQDQIINRDNYRSAKTNLPPGARIIEIEGLNHSDFGNYGLQKGDGRSSFSDEEVIELIISAFNGN